MKFRKIVEVEAFQLGVDDYPEWFTEMCMDGQLISIHHITKSGWIFNNVDDDVVSISVNNGDYIIKNIDGELSVCKPGIFEETHEKIVEGN